MNKFKIILSVLIVSSLMVSCSNKKEIGYNNNKVETENDLGVYEMYENIDKDTLQYNYENDEYEYYETENGFQILSSLNNTLKVNDKRYGQILKEYSFEVELNPIDITYDEAISSAKNVLPDDIKEELKKYDESTGIQYIRYSSKAGNFIVALNSSIFSCVNGKYEYNNEHICGLFYLKEK